MADIRVKYEDGDRLRIEVGGHLLTTDQPVEDGGGDLGPTPTDLFVASLAACVGLYAERFLRRHDLPVAGLGVDASFVGTCRSTRVESIDIGLSLPEGFPEERLPALQAVIEHCTVHNSIREAPVIRMQIGLGRRAAA